MKRKVVLVFTLMSLINSNIVFANDNLIEVDNLTLEENTQEYSENIYNENTTFSELNETYIENTKENYNISTGSKYIVNINSNSSSIKSDSLLLEKTENDTYLLTLIINSPNISNITFNEQDLTKNYSNYNITSVDLEINDLTNAQNITLTYSDGISENIEFSVETSSIQSLPTSYYFENGYYNIQNFTILKESDTGYSYDKSTSGYIKSIDVATLDGQNFVVVTFDETNSVFVNFTMSMELWYKDSSGEYVSATVTEISEKGCNMQFKFPVDSIENLIDFKYSYTVAEMSSIKGTYERIIYIDGSSAIKTAEVTGDDFVFDTSGEDAENSGNEEVEQAEDSSSTSSSSSSSTSSSSSSLDPTNLEDGTYSVNVNLWNASSDEASMGDDAIYPTAVLKVKDGEYTISISTKPMTLGIYKAVLKGLLILNTNGDYEEADVISTGLTLGDETDLPSAFSFTLPSKGEEYVKVRILTKFYPEFPNHDDLEARLKIDWSSLKLDSGASLTIYDSSSESEGVTYLEDEETGIKVTPNTETTFENTSLTVTVTNEDETISQIFEELEQDIIKFLRYDLIFIKDDEEVTPSDIFTVSIPVQEEFDLSKTEIYRLNDDNTLTLISYEIEDGYFIFKTSIVKTFIIVENANNTDDFNAEAIEVFVNTNENINISIAKNDFENHYANESIKFMKETGILVGKSENEFAPNEEVTLATIITAISRIEEIDTKKYSYGEELNYYEPAINWAIQAGLISKTDEPFKALTREEVANIVDSYLKLKGVNLKFIYNLTFVDDSEIDLKNKLSVYNLAKAGIISGRDGLVFNAKDFATRAELSIILEKIMNSYL